MLRPPKIQKSDEFADSDEQIDEAQEAEILLSRQYISQRSIDELVNFSIRIFKDTADTIVQPYYEETGHFVYVTPRNFENLITCYK